MECVISSILTYFGGNFDLSKIKAQNGKNWPKIAFLPPRFFYYDYFFGLKGPLSVSQNIFFLIFKKITVFDFDFGSFSLFLSFSYIFFVILQCVYNPQFLVSLSSFLHEVEKYDNLSFLSNFKENERFLFLLAGLEVMWHIG